MRHRSPWKAGIFKALIVLAAWALSPSWLGSAAPLPTEYQTKAMFLYNFAKFVEWPSQAFSNVSSPIIVAVVGNDALAEILDHALGGKLVQGRRLLVKRWTPRQGNLYCHILFISSSVRDRLPEIMQYVCFGVLTVGETDYFVQRGGMINFILSEDRLQFEINQKTAESAGLKISAKLLSLAKTVWE